MTDISQSTDYFLFFRAEPGLKLGQHHVECSSGGAITVSAAFVFARDHLQGLECCAMIQNSK